MSKVLLWHVVGELFPSVSPCLPMAFHAGTHGFAAHVDVPRNRLNTTLGKKKKVNLLRYNIHPSNTGAAATKIFVSY